VTMATPSGGAPALAPAALRPYTAELHVHTVLSPCAEVEMIPPLIVAEARERGIDLIAITDHNASANVAAVQEAALGSDLVVLPGMEVQTREEVHVLCLFDTLEQLAAWQAHVDAYLPPFPNDPEHFGEQFVVDASGDFVRREPRLLIVSTTLSFKEAIDGVTALGGIAIPAHVNRAAFSLLTNLGFVPPDVHPDALEISRHLSVAEARRRFPQIRGYPLIQSGDVHRLEEFLGANRFTLAAPTIAELRLALAGQAGRALAVGEPVGAI
jgi:PHP family Zn ribbon phosphoesterase